MNVNFNIQQEVFDSFLAAQNDGNIRYFKISIENETMILASTVNKDHTADIDFDRILVPNLNESEAALYIYSLKDHFLSADGWLLVVFVPDSCKVRDKMLYSSSKDYLKKKLGLQFFKHELAINDIKDISWSYFYTNNILNRSNLKVLSEQEKLIKEEKALTTQEVSSTVFKRASIGLQFDIDSKVTLALKEISNNMIIEIILVDERITHKSTKSISNNELLKTYISEDDACYYILQKNDTISMILSCPESVSARKKMTLASAKSTLSALCTDVGIKITKTIEISNNNDLDPLLQENKFDAASQAAIVKSSKPTAPGKKSTSRPKFVSEE